MAGKRGVFAVASWAVAFGLSYLAEYATVRFAPILLLVAVVVSVGTSLYFSAVAFNRRTETVSPPTLVAFGGWSFVGAFALIVLLVILAQPNVKWLWPIATVFGLAAYGMVIVGLVYISRGVAASGRERRDLAMTAPAEPARTRKASIASLVLGIVGMPVGLLVVSPLAIYFGLVGLRRAQRAHLPTDQMAAYGLAAGLVGSVILVTWVAALLISLAIVGE